MGGPYDFLPNLCPIVSELQGLVPFIDSKNQMDYTTKLGSYYFKKSLIIRKLHEGRRHE